jgi:hypothetical protein
MGRILVLLAAVCLVAAFAIMYKIDNNVASSNINASTAAGQQNKRAEKAGQAEKKPYRSPGKVAGKKGTNYSGSLSVSDPAESDATDDVGIPQPDAQDGRDAAVKPDSAPVYSLNSKNSKVLRSVKRGERLKTDIQVIDSEGRWSVVKGKGQSRPGFVRDEDLDRDHHSGKTPGASASNRAKEVREH